MEKNSLFIHNVHLHSLNFENGLRHNLNEFNQKMSKITVFYNFPTLTRQNGPNLLTLVTEVNISMLVYKTSTLYDIVFR